MEKIEASKKRSGDYPNLPHAARVPFNAQPEGAGSVFSGAGAFGRALNSECMSVDWEGNLSAVSPLENSASQKFSLL